MKNLVLGKYFILKVILLFICFSGIQPIRAQQHVYDFNVDSFRQVIMDGFTLNSPILVKDTFLFLSRGL